MMMMVIPDILDILSALQSIPLFHLEPYFDIKSHNRKDIFTYNLGL